MARGELDCDPRGLIMEAYRMDGLGPAECRTIFLDWAMGAGSGDGAVLSENLAILMAHYGTAHPDHPMTSVLREGLDRAARPRSRRGRRAATDSDTS